MFMMYQKKQALIILTSIVLIPLHAHETFTARPDIMRKQGIGIDWMVRHSNTNQNRETELLNKYLYGFNQHLTGELRIPFIFSKHVVETKNGFDQHLQSPGLGKIQPGIKLRIYKHYAKQRRDQIVFLASVLLPTASSIKTPIEKKPLIGNRSIDFYTGISGGFETTKWYHFFACTYRLNTTARQTHEGNILSYSYSLGYRPKPPRMNQVDLVILGEIEGITKQSDFINGKRNNNSGEHVTFFGPALFLSIKNLILKGAAQLPLFQHVNGNQPRHNFRAMIGAFLQF